MKTKILAAATVVSLAAAMLAIGLGGADAATTSCDEGHWPATVQGRPVTFHAGATAGYYIWHDSHGWHLRTTTPESRAHEFTGRIVSSDNIKVVSLVRDENDDHLSLSGHVVNFAFKTYKGVDGLDFVVGCTKSVTFLLKAGGDWVPAARIFLGDHGHAPSNPFTVYRTN